jgi:hypothetical protein
MMVDAFGVCSTRHIKDLKGQVNKLVVEELLFSHDIKPPYTNVHQWDVKKCKMSFNIRYPVVVFVVYQSKKVNYLNNKNRFTFMKVKEGTKVDWPYIMFNNLCGELDRWTKMKENMQVDAKHGDKKETYHSRLVLAIVYIHLLELIYSYVEKIIIITHKKTKRTKEEL